MKIQVTFLQMHFGQHARLFKPFPIIIKIIKEPRMKIGSIIITQSAAKFTISKVNVALVKFSHTINFKRFQVKKKHPSYRKLTTSSFPILQNKREHRKLHTNRRPCKKLQTSMRLHFCTEKKTICSVEKNV